eukprot:TRINITY_DN44263_c0_g1_i1.p1 TRINITY_DN44263_c0_g1~~TRINITY_DN44263_c0_g1_i1.p1  ORF type:complete len:162 (+),score=88.27 TRINITY_DN44263_c0_g1_i1:58-543(+)
MWRITRSVVTPLAAQVRWASGEKKKVLVLCTGNSCRSHIAEGLINQALGDEYEAVSAGTKPAGYVHPLAIKALDEVGCDISKNTSKHTDTVKGDYDMVITVCDNALENSPDWTKKNHIHLPFQDPADATGTEEQQLEVFRDVRDQINNTLLQELKGRGNSA